MHYNRSVAFLENQPGRTTGGARHTCGRGDVFPSGPLNARRSRTNRARCFLRCPQSPLRAWYSDVRANLGIALPIAVQPNAYCECARSGAV